MVLVVYMNSFNCKVTGATSTTSIGQQMLARQCVLNQFVSDSIPLTNTRGRCGDDTSTGLVANPGNCTIGPKYPIYWLQAEGNNVRPHVPHPTLCMRTS